MSTRTLPVIVTDVSDEATTVAVVVVTEHLRPGQLAEELALVEQRRVPPVPVVVRALHPGATRDVVLHGWATNPRGEAGMWGLVTGLRVYAPGFEAEVCWWLPADDIRPR